MKSRPRESADIDISLDDRLWWRGRRVLLTGHTGFKGAWLARWLCTLGADVTGFALPPNGDRPNLFRLLRLDKTLHSIEGDVRDQHAVELAFSRARPDVVFHLAAQAIVYESYARPHATFETNVLGTANVLEAVRSASAVRSVVVVTSDKCYLDRGLDRAYVEGDPLGGFDPYSASKAAQEIVAASYRSSFFSDHRLLATVRAGNVIGGGDWSAYRLIPDVIEALLANNSIPLRYPHAIRPWQHVLEPLSAYLTIGARLGRGERSVASAWNIGPRSSDHATVATVVERIAAAWDGAESTWHVPENVPPHEQFSLRLDASKAARELGIRPRFNFELACQRTANWYRALTDGGNATALCDADIRFFEEHPCQE